MAEKQGSTLIEKTKEILEDFNKEIKNIINVANSSLGELMKEKDSFFEKLKKIGINKLNENEAKIDDLNKEFNEITNLNIEIKNNLNEKLENIKEEITFKIDNVSDSLNFNINNLIKELSDEDNSTSKDSNNISVLTGLENEFEPNNFNSGRIDIEYQNEEDIEENNKQNEQLDKIIGNLTPIEKNSKENKNIISSNDGKNDIFLCKYCSKIAVYKCRSHCQLIICKEHYENICREEHHGFIKISDIVNRNSKNIISPEKDNLLNYSKVFLKNVFEKLSNLLNTNRIPKLEPNNGKTIPELEEQKDFLDKIFKEHDKLGVLNINDKKPNEELLSILKKITNSERIILQKGELSLNIYQIIDERAKFYISIFPHRNIDNPKEFSKKIEPIIDEKFPELKKNLIMDENNAFLIANENIDEKNYLKNIYITKETDIKNSIYILNNLHSLKLNFLIKYCQINVDNLDKKYDAIYFKSEGNNIIEGEKYYPPIGWFAIGLKNDIDPNWPIAYLTFNKKYNEDQLKMILNLIIEKKKFARLEYQSKEKEFDKRHWDILGKGIYLFPNIKNAEKYTGTFDINSKKYKIVLMVKVIQEKIKEPKHDKFGCWVVEKNYVKFCRILFKEVNISK